MSRDSNVLDLQAAFLRLEAERALDPPDDDPEDPGWQPEDGRGFQPSLRRDSGPAFDHEGNWAVQTAEAFTAAFIAPEYIIDGVVQRGRLYTLTAPTGSGKTALMLYAAATISTGKPFGDCEVETGDVLFLAGENPDDVRARFIATMEFYGIDPPACRVHFVAGTFSLRADMERLKEAASALTNLVLVIVDTFACYFDGDDENNNAQALDFARIARRITAFPSRPAVIMPAHPVKNATPQNLAPKGGSSLVNEVDGNLTLWRDQDVLTLHWQVKFRGAEFEPLKFELERYTSDRLRDRKGRMMPTVLAKPMLETRVRQVAMQTLSDENRLLLNVRHFPAQSVADRAVEIGLKLSSGTPHKSRVHKLLLKLRDQKLIKQFRSNWELTPDGKRAAEMIQNGENFAAEGGL